MINATLSPNLIYVIVMIVIIIIVLLILIIQLKKKKQINMVCEALNKFNYQINEISLTKREIIVLKNEKRIAIKMIIGGKNKGIVITNKDTYFMRVYKNTNSSYIDSWKIDEVKKFINQYPNDDRIIIVLGGYARITKYINENELEAVTIKNDAFGTKVLSFADFKEYLKGK